MARKYSKAASKKVKSALHREERGRLKSGKGGKGGTVTSRKQAIAIGLSEARAEGKKVPSKKASKKATKKTSRTTKKSAKKTARKTTKKTSKKAARHSKRKSATK